MSLTVDPNTNRINAAHFGYDAAGNMTSMPNPVGGGAQMLGYDHENRVTMSSRFRSGVANSSITETYTYNHRNQRVSRTAGGQTDYYLYGAVGEMVGRYRVRTYNLPDSGGTVEALSCEEKFFYLGGRLLKKQDRLGSTSSFYPYGEDKTESVAGGSFRFATYWRDGGGTGLDYARNRYYSATYGRFTSADPLDDSASPTNSQSWNRFAYVQGDPANLLDSDGLGPINAQSCEDAKRMAQQAGGQAHFTCPTVSFSVTVTARPAGSAFNPGYQYGPGAMPGSIFDAHRPPVPTGPPSGTSTGGGDRKDNPAWCDSLPTKSVVGFSSTFGNIAPSAIGTEWVTDLRTGEVTMYATIGAGGGLSGGLMASFYAGYTWDQGADPRDKWTGSVSLGPGTVAASGGLSAFTATLGISTPPLIKPPITLLFGQILYSPGIPIGPTLAPSNLMLMRLWESCK